MTVLDRHKQAWADCTSCNICFPGTRHVFYRGPDKPKYLFVGPQPTEADAGANQPFFGSDGIYLASLLSEAYPCRRDGGYQRNIGYCHAVLSVPYDDDMRVRKATAKEVKACAPRVAALFTHLNVKYAIYCHSVPNALRKLLEPQLEDHCEIQHPEYIMKRSGDIALDHNRSKLTLTDFFKRT